MTAREPRPLKPSPDLLRALAICEAASVKGLRGARRKKPTISLAALGRIEEEIGARLHDDVLVLLALRDPVATLLTGLEDINSISEAADEVTAPPGYVCISTVYSEPVEELVLGYHGGPFLYLAAPLAPRDGAAEVRVGRDSLEGAKAMTLAAFLEQMLHEARSGEAQDEVSIPSTRGPTPLEPAPELIRGHTWKPRSSAGGRVSHPKFGVGEVISRIGDGESQKIVVRFEDKERTLLARFVTPCE